MPKFVRDLSNYVQQASEAGFAFLFYWLFRSLPIDISSGLAGWIARNIGPKLKVSMVAQQNLKRAFPEITPQDLKRTITEMWDNLGRVVGEYPHLPILLKQGGGQRVEIIGAEHIDMLRDDNKPGIFFMAHIGNWEFSGLASEARNLPVDRVYRQANNPLTEWLLRRGRAGVDGPLIPKGRAGAKKIIKSLKAGNHLAMLVDQKMNDGISVPFFGIEAMTAPAIAQLALRFDCPVVPVRVKRLNGAYFQVIVKPPLSFSPSGNQKPDIHEFMKLVNLEIESWIRETPGQWLWVHNRWPG